MESAILIKKGEADYDGLKWLLKAVSKEESRYSLQYVEIKEHRTRATDGHRLHEYTLVVPENFPDGLYRPYKIGNTIILIKDSSGAEYPQADEIFPKDKPTKTLDNISGFKSPALDKSFTSILRVAPQSDSLMIDYVKDMLSCGDSFKVEIFGEHKTYLFRNENKRGLIMPLRM